MIGVQLGSKYASDKDSKYVVNFKLTQIVSSYKKFYRQKKRGL